MPPSRPWMGFWGLQDREPDIDCLADLVPDLLPSFSLSKAIPESRPPLSASTATPRETIAGMLQKVDTRKDNSS